MKVFKKLVTVLVASCFMLSIANLPAYSASSELKKLETTETQEYTGDFTSVNVATSKPKAATSVNATKSSVNQIAKITINLINNLLKKKGVSTEVKNWLKKAKTLINSIKNGKKTNAAKYTWLQKALTSITAITKAKGSVLSVIKQTVTSGSVFSSLKSVLKKNATYKVYANYTAK